MLIATGGLILSWGAADPPVAGPVVWSDTTLNWLEDGNRPLNPGEVDWFTAPATLPPDGFTVTVLARFTPDSDPGAAWGIWLAAADGTRVVYAISGEQYTTTRVCPALAWLNPASYTFEECPAQRPEWEWSAYVRLNPVGVTNHLTLHREASGEVRLRLNRETLGAAAVAYTGDWGVWRRGG